MVIREILFSPCFFSTIEKLFPPFSPPPPESNIAIKDKRKSRVARYYSKTIQRFLPSPPSSPISVSLETTQHPPLLSLLFIFFIEIRYSHSVGTERKMFTQDF